MKNKITAIMLLMSIYISNAQEGITIGFAQDIKLATSKDKAGNTPFTLDLMIHADLEIKQYKHFYPAIRLQYEYAKLSGGEYHRYGVGTGIVFNKISTPEVWFIPAYDYPNLEASVFITGGMLLRPTIKTYAPQPTYGAAFELRYKTGEHIKFFLRTEFYKRPDKISLYDDKSTKPNNSVGIIIY